MTCPGFRCLVVATLRDTEPSEALDHTLGELLTLRGAERLAVVPLALQEVKAVVAGTLEGRVDAQVLNALYDRTGGNVFYLLELVRFLESEYRDRALTAEDVTSLDVPSGVRDVILRRVGRLPDNTRAILTLASVAGQDADLDLLEHAALLDAEQLMLALEPAVAAGLLAADDSRWGHSFRHPLIQESIYAGISRVERNRLHARVAASLEALPDGGRIGRPAQLAHHYLAAGSLGGADKVIASCRSAARAASEVGAWSEAIRLLSEALAAAGRSTSSGSPALRCDLLVDLGGVYRAAGRIVESHEALQQAIDLADGIGDEERVLAAAVGFGAVSLWGSRAWAETDHRLVAVLERQLARLGGAEDNRTVRLLSTLASELYFDQDAAAGLGYAERALELGRRLGDPAALGIAISGYLISTLANDRLGLTLAAIEEFLDRPEARTGPGGGGGTAAQPADRTAALRGVGPLRRRAWSLPGARHGRLALTRARGAVVPCRSVPGDLHGRPPCRSAVGRARSGAAAGRFRDLERAVALRPGKHISPGVALPGRPGREL